MATTLQNTSQELALSGETALACLLSGQDGKVLAAGRRAVFFRSGSGDVFWLTGPGSPRHRRGMQIRGDLPSLKPDSCYQVRDRCLTVEAGFKIDFSNPSLWKAKDLLPEGRFPPEALSAQAETLLNCLVDRSDVAGLGCLLRAILCLIRCQDNGREICQGSAILSAAWDAIGALVRAGQANDSPGVLRAASKLVGLGEGLTPSGDDFLGGLFFCRQVLGQVYPSVFPQAEWDFNEFIQECESSSNWISYALLQDHALGHSFEPLHRLADGLLSGDSPDRLLPAAVDLLAIGHSSGWDILTGFLTGLLLAAPRKPPGG